MKLWAHKSLGEIESLHRTKKGAEAARDKSLREWEDHCFPEDETIEKIEIHS